MGTKTYHIQHSLFKVRLWYYFCWNTNSMSLTFRFGWTAWSGESETFTFETGSSNVILLLPVFWGDTCSWNTLTMLPEKPVNSWRGPCGREVRPLALSECPVTNSTYFSGMWVSQLVRGPPAESPQWALHKSREELTWILPKLQNLEKNKWFSYWKSVYLGICYIVEICIFSEAWTLFEDSSKMGEKREIWL